MENKITLKGIQQSFYRTFQKENGRYSPERNLGENIGPDCCMSKGCKERLGNWR